MYDKSKSDNRARSSAAGLTGGRVARASVYLYVVVMSLLFANQAYLSIDKYLDKEIVEEVSMTREETAHMPPLTFCLLPGYTKAMDVIQMQQVENFCPDDDTDFKTCIDDLRFDLADLVVSTFRYPGTDVSPGVDPEAEEWRPNSFNLAVGSCFTRQDPREDAYSSSVGDIIILNMTNPQLAAGYSLMAHVHNEDAFLPSMGISREYMGQNYISISPEPATFNQIIVDVTHRTLLNSDKRPCEPDPEYSVVQCMEQFVSTAVGCASPWNLHKNSSFSDCESSSEFASLFSAHLEIFNTGALQFEKRTGCLPPCTFADFEFNYRSFKNPQLVSVFGGEAITGIALSLKSTNQKVVKEAWLYQLHNLVGEVGGCLGMFLGVSLISLYQLAIGAVNRAYKYIIP